MYGFNASTTLPGSPVAHSISVGASGSPVMNLLPSSMSNCRWEGEGEGVPVGSGSGSGWPSRPVVLTMGLDWGRLMSDLVKTVCPPASGTSGSIFLERIR